MKTVTISVTQVIGETVSSRPLYQWAIIRPNGTVLSETSATRKAPGPWDLQELFDFLVAAAIKELK